MKDSLKKADFRFISRRTPVLNRLLQALKSKKKYGHYRAPSGKIVMM